MADVDFFVEILGQIDMVDYVLAVEITHEHLAKIVMGGYYVGKRPDGKAIDLLESDNN